MDKSAEEPLFKTTASQDNFYDTIETSTPEYDNAVNNSQAPGSHVQEVSEEQKEEWRSDLSKLEEEIHTLRTVLQAKVNQAAELKRKLGITPMTELKYDFKQGIVNIKDSDAYRKTNETFLKINQKITSTPAYQKTNTAFKSFGAFASKKFGDMRNSNSFKSFEDKLGGAYTNVKSSRSIGNLKSKMTKMRGSQSENNFGEALSTPEEPTSAENMADSTTLPPGDDIHKPL